MKTAPNEVTELDDDECLGLLEQNHLGRVAVNVAGVPAIFPVNYGVTRRALVFRTAPGTKAEWLPLGRVAFEIDGVDRDARSVWSVMVRGVGHDITDALDHLSEAMQQVSVFPVVGGDRGYLMQITIDELSGRRFPLAEGVTP